VTGGWRKLHNEELHNLCSPPSIIKLMKSRRMRWVHNKHEQNMNAYRVLVGKPEANRPLERSRRRCEDNIKMDFGEVGWGDMGSINVARYRDQWTDRVNTVMNLRVS
jgi:hypothetical protein